MHIPAKLIKLLGVKRCSLNIPDCRENNKSDKKNESTTQKETHRSIKIHKH